jgi:predicted AAA+ superfamily ATPase
MTNFDYHPLLDPSFVNREAELRWLNESVTTRRGWGKPIVVAGVGGVGKTALLKQFIASGVSLGTVVWLDIDRELDTKTALAKFIEDIYSHKHGRNQIIVIDGAEALTDEQIRDATNRLFNLKAVSSVLLAGRRSPIVGGAEILELEPLSEIDAVRLLQMLLPPELASATIETAVRATQGLPLAVLMFAGILKSGRLGDLSDLLGGRIYDLSRVIGIPSTKLEHVPP